jgi:hypothetical protein
MAKRNRLSPATFINANRWRVTPQDAAQRFAERDARIAADTCNEAQRFLGDPPPSRSALANVSAPGTDRGSVPPLQRGLEKPAPVWHR